MIKLLNSICIKDTLVKIDEAAKSQKNIHFVIPGSGCATRPPAFSFSYGCRIKRLCRNEILRHQPKNPFILTNR